MDHLTGGVFGVLTPFRLHVRARMLDVRVCVCVQSGREEEAMAA